MPAACVNTAQINGSLSNIFVPLQLLAGLRAVAASVSTRGSLSTYQGPRTLLFVSSPDGLHYREKFYQQVLLVPGNAIPKFKEELIFCVR